MSKLIDINGLLKLPPEVQDKQEDDNIIVSFKGRTIDDSKPIYVYRNLNKKGKVYSIKQDGVVVAHTTAICIGDAEFIINKSGKAKAIKTRIRNVHAFIRGKYRINGMGTTAKRNDLPIAIKYNPFDNNGFHYLWCGKAHEVKKAWFAIINEEGVKVAYI